MRALIGITAAVLAIVLTPTANAVQPYSEGIKQLRQMLDEVSQLILLNEYQSLSEVLSTKDVLRLSSEYILLQAQKATLSKDLALSNSINASNFVLYAMPQGESSNNSLHTDPAGR